MVATMVVKDHTIHNVGSGSKSSEDDGKNGESADCNTPPLRTKWSRE